MKKISVLILLISFIVLITSCEKCGNDKIDEDETMQNCCEDVGCLGEQSCVNHVCIEPTCRECQYLEDHKCKDYECCKDIDCDDNSNLTLDKCYNPKTLNSYCENINPLRIKEISNIVLKNPNPDIWVVVDYGRSSFYKHNGEGLLASVNPDGFQQFDTKNLKFKQLSIQITNPFKAVINHPAQIIELHTNEGKKIEVYLPAVKFDKTHGSNGDGLNLYVNEKGSTYYSRKDHKVGQSDMDWEDSLIEEHLAQKSVLPSIIEKEGCIENWNCGGWSQCENGKQTRICTDKNNCGTINNRPEQEKTCIDISIEEGNWITVDFDETREFTEDIWEIVFKDEFPEENSDSYRLLIDTSVYDVPSIRYDISGNFDSNGIGELGSVDLVYAHKKMNIQIKNFNRATHEAEIKFGQPEATDFCYCGINQECKNNRCELKSSDYKVGVLYVYYNQDTYNPSWRNSINSMMNKFVNGLKQVTNNKINPSYEILGEHKTNLVCWNPAEACIKINFNYDKIFYPGTEDEIKIENVGSNQPIMYNRPPGSNFPRKQGQSGYSYNKRIEYYSKDTNELVAVYDYTPYGGIDYSECNNIIEISRVEGINEDYFSGQIFDNTKLIEVNGKLIREDIQLKIDCDNVIGGLTNIEPIKEAAATELGFDENNYNKIFVIFGKLGAILPTNEKAVNKRCTVSEPIWVGWSDLKFAENSLLDGGIIDCTQFNNQRIASVYNWQTLVHEVLHRLGAKDVYDTGLVFGYKTFKELALEKDPLADESVMGNRKRECAPDGYERQDLPCTEEELNRIYLDKFNRERIGIWN